MGEVFIDEFLYRFRPLESGAWHVTLAEWRKRSDGRIIVEDHRTLTPEQAEKEGFPFPKVLETINLDVLKQADALREMYAALEAEYKAYKDKAEADLEAAQAAYIETQKAIENLQTAVAELKKQLEPQVEPEKEADETAPETV